MSYVLNTTSLDNLKKMCDGNNYDLIVTLVELYVNSTPTEVNEIENCLRKKDIQTLCRVAHSLKSSSGNLGITDIMICCATIEKETLDKSQINSNLIEVNILKIRRLLPEVQRELMKYLEKIKKLH